MDCGDPLVEKLRAAWARRSASTRLAALSEMLLALDFSLDTPKEIVILTRNSRDEAEPLLQEFRRTFLPNRILTLVSQGGELDSHATLVPLLEYKVARNGRPTAYVCERRVCELPTNDPEVFAGQLRGVSRKQ